MSSMSSSWESSTSGSTFSISDDSSATSQPKLSALRKLKTAIPTPPKDNIFTPPDSPLPETDAMRSIPLVDDVDDVLEVSQADQTDSVLLTGRVTTLSKALQDKAAVALEGSETRVEYGQPQEVPHESPILTLRQGKKLFTVYKVVIKNSERQWAIYKRYSEFDLLDKTIQKHFPYIHKHLPQFPPKRYIWDNMDPSFVSNRSAGLNKYIQSVFTSQVLMKSLPVKDFLCGTVHEGQYSPAMSSRDTTASEASDVVSRPPTPKAVFNTPAGHPSQSPIKSSLRQPTGIRKTLKKVAWRKSVVDTPPVDQEPRTTSSSSASAETMVTLEDFYLLKLIGKGNFGKVMLAQNKDDHQVYAIKVISKSSVKRKNNKQGRSNQKATGKHDVDHIMTERNVLISSREHPFLIGLKWSFQTSQKLYFVTDYVNGGELFFWLQKEVRFSELRSRFYAAEITSALAYLHTECDVVYRDLKPENILLDSEGHVRLTDFGLAKEQFLSNYKGRTSTFCGTPEYLAPETIRKEQYGFPVDWWCLGSVLYEMLVGLPPFYSKNTQEMYDKILNDKLKFPAYVSIRARSLICGLLHRSAAFRLGTGEDNTSNPQVIFDHPFFEGLDWQKLYRREYAAPFVPTISHMYDLRNIDPTFVNEPLPQSVLEDSALKNTLEVEVSAHPAGQTFKGFTYQDSFLQGDHENP